MFLKSLNNHKLPMKTQIAWIASLAAMLLVIEIVNIVTGRFLNQYSILPRELPSLGFIFTAPFLHASTHHFLSNLVTLCIFSFLLLQFGTKRFINVSFLLVVFTGLLVWMFGRSAFHLGASGIIYGYFAYLLLAGILSKKVSLTLISVLVFFFYGGLIWGVLPSAPYISWESHLFGFLSGLVIAWFGFKRSN